MAVSDAKHLAMAPIMVSSPSGSPLSISEQARTMTYRACSLIDNGDPEGELTMMGAMAKCFASDTAMSVTTDAVQLLGGYGYTKDFPVERFMRDAKITQIYEGTNQIQRVVIAKGLLG